MYNIMPNIYRNSVPTGKYDLLIVSLIHQDANMVRYIINNIEKYVKGSFIWIAHYNGAEPIDENTLPEWAWLVRNTHATSPWRRTISFGIIKALTFAIENEVKFTNALVLSSGSAFYREFQVPTVPKVCLDSHETLLNPSAKLNHVEEIDIVHIGKCADYLKSVGSMGWQYEYGGDSDVEFHKLILNRGFKFMKGNQFSGQMWPYEVALMLESDIKTLYGSESPKYYVTEEIFFSTYAYNYAKIHNIQIDLSIVIIDWEKYYNISSLEYIDSLRNNSKLTSYAACKLSDNVLSDPVRRYIQN